MKDIIKVVLLDTGDAVQFVYYGISISDIRFDISGVYDNRVNEKYFGGVAVKDIAHLVE